MACTIYVLSPKSMQNFTTRFRDSFFYEIPQIGLKFNLCRLLANPCDKKTIETPATISNGSSCVPILQTENPIYEDDKSMNKSYSWVADKGDAIVITKFEKGEPCPAGGFYSLRLDIMCNAKILNKDIQFKLLSDPLSCNIHLSSEAEAACPVFSLSWLIDQYFFIFTLVFLIAGGFMTFYGLRMFTRVLFTFGALAIGSLALVCFLWVTAVTRSWYMS